MFSAMVRDGAVTVKGYKEWTQTLLFSASKDSCAVTSGLARRTLYPGDSREGGSRGGHTEDPDRKGTLT